MLEWIDQVLLNQPLRGVLLFDDGKQKIKMDHFEVLVRRGTYANESGAPVNPLKGIVAWRL